MGITIGSELGLVTCSRFLQVVIVVAVLRAATSVVVTAAATEGGDFGVKPSVLFALNRTEAFGDKTAVGVGVDGEGSRGTAGAVNRFAGDLSADTGGLTGAADLMARSDLVCTIFCWGIVSAEEEESDEANDNLAGDCGTDSSVGASLVLDSSPDTPVDWFSDSSADLSVAGLRSSGSDGVLGRSVSI